MSIQQRMLKWLFFIFLPKLPIFLLAFPFVVLMRMLRPVIWIRLIPVYEQIGHAIGNTEVYLLERRAGMDPSKTIDIFYPIRPWKINRQLVKMWKKVILLYEFVYWIAWVNLEIPGYQPHHFVPPHNDRDVYGLSNDTPPQVSFTRKEEDRGAVLLRDMGIPQGSSIVTFHARDNSYQRAVVPDADSSFHNHRDVDIDTLTLAIKELVARGYYAIRMGKVVNKPFGWKHPQVIDYATSSWRNDFNDLYLVSRCHFHIGTSCGMDAVALFFRKPRVVLNAVIWRAVDAWSPEYLYIFKRFWLIKEKRFLAFKEIINSEIGYSIDPALYKKAGLEIINNTPEEIFDVIVEKEERMRGTWQTNDEFEDLQRRFWRLFTPDRLNKVFKARVGSKFLLHNKDLLE